MNLTPTIELLELLVFVIGVVGITISLIMLSIIQGDRRNLRIAKLNGVNKRLTNADLRNELSRTYKLVGFTVIALLAMTAPPPLNQQNRLAGEILKWLLISWEVVAVINSLWAYVDRVKNRDALRAIEQAKHQEEVHE